MSQLVSIESPQEVSAPGKEHLARWHRLQEERRFRVEQLATLDQELAAPDRHECVKLALRIAARSALAEVDAALARMAEGRYGACVTCAQQIPAERLDVLPMTPLCTSCHYNAQNCRLVRGRLVNGVSEAGVLDGSSTSHKPPQRPSERRRMRQSPERLAPTSSRGEFELYVPKCDMP